MLSPENEAAPISEEFIGSIAIVRFCRPSQRNPLSSEMLEALANLVQRIKVNPSVRALIFTGTADVFASGADIRELSTIDVEQAKGFSQTGQRLMQQIADLKPVTIAAINGFCMGGALDFALACDIRVACKSAIFAHPGARLGIITGWGGTQRLPRLIGKAKALELFATARRLSSEEALAAGLITQIGDPVLDAAIALANKSIATF
ncbi:MAG TPA: enoyl-CoA hydratase/isomerase family protein [Pyrinomonadaceae bacterium]|nr:enoyl-CoA hydratase/isomerase family protein [Pyrinomonadaceae bacterium]